jgi:Na+-transporting NADH:ubiquinone oxidoreductase subunit NqrC
MKFSFPRPPARSQSGGSTVLVVLVLLGCMALFIAGNLQTLRHLKQELKLLDDQQLKKYGQGARH